MKERPILFTGEMVRAILDGRKTQTRRLVKPQPMDGSKLWGIMKVWDERRTIFWREGQRSNYGVALPVEIGDRLWVRETWAPHCEMRGAAIYRCDRGGDYQDTVTENFRWRPSIHMPRWASRIDLEITALRVERVQDISDEDAEAEGIVETPSGRVAALMLERLCGKSKPPVVVQFAGLWQSIYGNWDTNPWVWVYEFRRIKP